jgi:hypothetical protein
MLSPNRPTQVFKAATVLVALVISLTGAGVITAVATSQQHTQVAAQVQDCPGDMHWIVPCP